MLDYPENASFVDSAWRTALLQPQCRVDNKFMLDIDTKDFLKLADIDLIIKKSNGEILTRYETPNGYHYITNPFDTRKVCEEDNVTLLRDGYYYIKTIGKEK